MVFIKSLNLKTRSQSLLEYAMPEFFTGRALFLLIIASLNGVSFQTEEIHNEAFFQVLSRLQQPASLELWTDQSCGMHFDVERITTRLKAQNTTFIYHRDMVTASLLPYITTISLRNLPEHLYRYIIIDICLLEDVATELEVFQYFFQRVNFILSTASMVPVTSAHEVYCSTMQLIWAPQKNVTLLGLPEKSDAMTGCSQWQLHDYQSLTKLFPFRVPWLHNVATFRTLKNAVIRGKCNWQCNISESISLSSQVYNFTIGKCPRRQGHCDFVEFGDRRVVRGIISTGSVLPLVIFSSQNFGFLAPKGALRPKLEYLARPFHLSLWIGFFSTFAVLLCFLFLRFNCRRSSFAYTLSHLWRLSEFLICSFFAPVSIPTRARISGVLLLIWALLMQIPASGFRAVMTSFLSEPPRAKPISDLSELAVKLFDENDTTILCLHDDIKQWALFDIYDTDLHIFVGDSILNFTTMRKNVDMFKTVQKIVSPKLRYSNCDGYVRNGTGVFYGLENRLRATGEDDTKRFWKHFTRLHYIPNIAYMSLYFPFRKSLPFSILRVFESHVESHLDTVHHIRHAKRFSGRNELPLSPHTIEDLWVFIQVWFCGILMAGIVLLLECVVSRSQRIFTGGCLH